MVKVVVILIFYGDLWYYNNSKIKNKKQEFQFAASCPNASKGSGYDKMLGLTLKIMEFEFQII